MILHTWTHVHADKKFVEFGGCFYELERIYGYTAGGRAGFG